MKFLYWLLLTSFVLYYGINVPRLTISIHIVLIIPISFLWKAEGYITFSIVLYYRGENKTRLTWEFV